MSMFQYLKTTRFGKLFQECMLFLLFSPALMAADLDPAGLVLYMPCENAENPIDMSADPTTPVVQGTLSLADGQFGTQGLEFDGNAANRIAVTHAPKLEGMSALTIEMWALGRNIASYEGMSLTSKRNAYSDGDVYNLFIWTGQFVNGRINGNNTNIGLSTTAIQDNTWYHIALVFDGQGPAGEQIMLYINGVLESSNDHPDGAVNTGGAPVWIGELDAERGFVWDGVLDEIGLWNVALSEAEINQLMVESKTKLLKGELASDPTPADGVEDVLRTTDLAWEPGEYAATHNVYFGRSQEDVNAAHPATLIAEGLARDDAHLDIERLEFGQTYYWRVDEVNGAPDYAVIEGEIWRFTVEPLAYAVENITASSNGIADAGSGPENTVNGSGLNDNDEHSIAVTDAWLAVPDEGPLWIQYEFDRPYMLDEMWVWNCNTQFEFVLGFGLKDVTVEYSLDGIDWTALGDVEFAQAPSSTPYQANTTIDFGGAIAQFVRLTVNNAWMSPDKVGLSEVRFMQIPTFARHPQPADGEIGVAPDTTLRWRAGREAESHDVYLGTDQQAVADETALAGSVSMSDFVPTDLELGSTYYWKIDEVNEAEAVTTWASDLWSFQTLEYITVDDFESYDDEDNVVYESWLDGWYNYTGSWVGYLEAPFLERSIVHGGGQSMPLAYDNSLDPFYSEAQYDLGGMDWDIHGADTLRLFVAGQTPAFAESADGTIAMNAIGADIWNAADEFRYAWKSLSGDGSLIAQVDSLAVTDPWAKGGVMIRETLEAGAPFAAVYLTGSNGVRYQARLEADLAAVSDSDIVTDEQLAQQAPVWVKIERVGDTFNGYYSSDGETWIAVAWNPQTIAMGNDVTIGLALTSHNSDDATGATFAGVTGSDNVSGDWQIAEIGVAQPQTGNDLATLYVAIEDTAGNVAVATHPDAAVRSAWTEWQIPFSALAGVNLNSVDTMYIGLGDRDNPSAGATGQIYIDDIQFGRPASDEAGM